MKKIVFITLLLLTIAANGQTASLSGYEESSKAQELVDLNADNVAAQAPQVASEAVSEDNTRTGRADRLLKTADRYFDKMWYAEAAEYYDKALRNNIQKQSIELLQKAGDAHYFNANMKMAHFWYSKLFDRYENEVSESDVFKYAHILKGIGRYKKAKRLMRVFTGKSHSLENSKAKRRLEASSSNRVKDSFYIKNLDFNSENSDFSPMLVGDNTMVFTSAKDSLFLNTRRYKWNNQPFLDLYIGNIDTSSNSLSNVKKLPKSINTKYHEATASFSPDHQTIYFTRNNYGKKLKRDKKGINHLKIYRSTKNGKEWSSAVELPFNSESYSRGHPAVSPDGKQLFFVSDMPGGFGKTDIYVVDILEDGGFSAPKNLGKALNTSEKEMFPFITESSIYFSSDRPLGFGGLDIYKANYSEDLFEVATNIGQPLNSNRDDFSYIIDEQGDKGYFASNRKGGKGDDDIYSFKRFLVEQPLDKTSIKGTVTELITGTILPNAIVALLDENNNKIDEVTTDADGQFVFDEVLNDATYTVQTNLPEYFEQLTPVVTAENTAPVSLDIELERLEEMIVVEDGAKKLKPDVIYFEFDKFSITTKAATELDKIVEVLQSYPGMAIKIESHTDSRGKRAYNRYLSDKRAKASKDYLISKGIAPDRILSAKGYGEDRLLNPCTDGTPCSRSQHELNRRSEFIIVEM